MYKWFFLRVFARVSAYSGEKHKFGKSYQTARPIGTKCGTHVHIHMGIDIHQTNCLSRHKGDTWGVLGGQQFKHMVKLSDWHQLWFTSADSSGNGHRLNTSHPSIPQGTFGGRGHTFKSLGSCQTAAPVDTEFGTHRRIRLGMDIG